MSRTVKKTIVLCLIAAIAAVAITASLFGCAPVTLVSRIAIRDDVDLTRLDFVTGSYDRTKPTLIYFHGLTESDEPVDFVRPAEYDDVLDTGESSAHIALKTDLKDYWSAAGWNLALFRFEGEASKGKPEFYRSLFSNLLEEFINVYRLSFADQAEQFETVDASDAKGLNEIRFAGDSVGASFAAYAAECVSLLVREDRLSEFYLPWRLTLVNPDLDNGAFPSEISDMGAGDSPLSGVTNAVKNAAVSGHVVGELIESDMRYSESYASPYSEEETEVYAQLLSFVACLEINESFSATADWSPSLRETVAKVWYLASVGGSDYDATGGSSVPSTQRNLLPFINNPKENYNNSVSFSVSAWTPTAAIRGLRGLRFRSANYNSSDTPKHTERVVTKFRLELFESSFLTQTAPRVGGYLFLDKNGDIYMNDGRLSVMPKGTPVYLRYTVTGHDETKLTAYSDSDGFYMFEIPAEAYQVSVYVDYYKPDYRYAFAGKDSGGKTNDELCSMASANGAGTYISSNWRDQYSMVKNCGYRQAV